MSDVTSPAAPGRRPHPRRVAEAVVRTAATTVLLVVAYVVVPIDGGGEVVLRSALGVVLLAAVVAMQARQVVRSEHPMLRAGQALVVVAVTLLVVAATIYLRVSATNEAAFSEPLDRVDALYLSMMTMTTVGFGDIGAVSDGARIAVMLHMVLNLAVLGVAVRAIMATARRRSDLGMPVTTATGESPDPSRSRTHPSA